VEVCCKNKNWNEHSFIIYLKYEWIPNSIHESYYLYDKKCYAISDEGLRHVSSVNYVYDGNKVLEHKIFDYIDFKLPEFRGLKKVLEERKEKILKDDLLIRNIIDRNENLSIII
jgi:AAA+ superfamily predicted ATPase